MANVKAFADKWTADGQTDRPITMCPRSINAGHKNINQKELSVKDDLHNFKVKSLAYVTQNLAMNNRIDLKIYQISN